MSNTNRRTQEERLAATRKTLLTTARKHFIKYGFQSTSTAAVVEDAGVTRGALYHHFSSKLELFDAVIVQESLSVAETIRRREIEEHSPEESLLVGIDSFYDAMKVKGRTHLLLVEAPAVLGAKRLAEIDHENSEATLEEGLSEILGGGAKSKTDPSVLAALLSAAFDRGALLISTGGNEQEVRRSTRRLVEAALEV